MRAALLKATSRLKEEVDTTGLVSHLLATVDGLVSGEEAEHLFHILKVADCRGSDVELDSQSVFDGSCQVWPYPAFVWQWTVVQSYPWRLTQHINVLDFAAFLNYVRAASIKEGFGGKRFVHILDSRVVSCVVAKGRSSSRLLNRVARRLCGLLLASDAYVVPVWTISSWNYSDAASRVFDDG